VGFIFAAMFESNQTWYMQKILLQYIVCAGKLGSMSCCLVGQQSRLMFMLVISITGIFCDTSNLEPYTSVWVLTVVGA
jgi:hypothetical protein